MAQTKHVTWVEISKSALNHNLNVFKRLLHKGQSLMPVVKSNAYGHGIVEVSSLLVDKGIKQLAVNSVEEARCLREQGLDPHILVMGAGVSGLPKDVAGLNDVELVVTSAPYLKWLSRAGSNTGVCIKLDTGLSRLGFVEEEIPDLIERLQKLKGIEVRSLMSHFANVEDVTDHEYAWKQMRQFKKMLRKFTGAGYRGLRKHIAGSAATLLFNESVFTDVRIGISLYGLWPSQETRLSMHLLKKRVKKLIPVMQWRTRVVALKKVPANTYVGYGCSYKTTSKSIIAVLPVGYYEGYSRHLSNKGYVLVNGSRAPLVGRVCMNMCMADVTNIPGVEVGSVATLLGKDGKEEITAEDLAAHMGTINYEVVTAVNANLPRVMTR